MLRRPDYELSLGTLYITYIHGKGIYIVYNVQSTWKSNSLVIGFVLKVCRLYTIHTLVHAKYVYNRFIFFEQSNIFFSESNLHLRAAIYLLLEYVDRYIEW